MRPGRPSRTAVIVIMVCLALWGVARATGSGWIIVVISVAGAIVVTGAVLPAVALTTLRIEAKGPRDATTSEPMRLVVTVEGPACRIRGLDPPGEWHGVDAPAEGALEVVAQQRGRVATVELEVACAAPLGIMWWHRRRRVDLPAPVLVAPAAIAHDDDARSGVAGEADAGPPMPGEGDLVRSAREYQAGDPVRLMHWGATARRGVPMVKELERLGEPGLVVTVDLSGRPADQEVAAGRALGLCEAAIGVGRRTWLVTRTGSSIEADEVASPLQAARRLAVAGAGPPAAVPGTLASVEHAVVSAWHVEEGRR